MFDSESYKKGFNEGVAYATKKREPEVVHTAHWISEKQGVSHYTYICDHCYGKSRFRKSKFCPDCGYQMTEKGKGTAIWASEIEKFPIEVTKYHFPEK